MRAMIWAAGLGTRLRPLTENMPKAMVPVLGKPMLEHALLACKKAGITEVVVNVHYFYDVIQAYFGNGSRLGMKISYSFEEHLLENAGGLVRVKEFFEDGPFVAFGSDNLADIDLEAMMASHDRSGALATIATTKADDVSKYGIVGSDAQGRITSFQEKPAPSEALGDQIATCIYGFSPEIFDYLPPAGSVCHFGRDVFPRLLVEGVALNAYAHPGAWDDVGNPKHYLDANFDALDRLAESGEDVVIGADVTVADTARIIGPAWIGNEVSIGAHAVVGPYVVLGDHCNLDAHAQVDHSVVWAHAHLLEDSQVSASVLADHCKIYSGTRLERLVVGNAGHLNRIPLEPAS